MKAALSFLVLLISLSGSLQAQEGFPLDGTWRGFWSVPGEEETLVVIVMDLDGENINGRINPGRNMVFFEEASLDPENWMVRFTSTSKADEPIVFEGTLENLGAYDRTITGTWTIAGVENQLVLTRE
ncbi:MAG: hypothetical protein HOH14_11110 [Gammaproteobacteria bacterium]|jgi:hypothetical protein|nr:hypothetical protein [Gammaproteobacteria bacterium]MBT6044028.1 hypothetical protein [Gammaproteobacteria bacterium]